ncbi:cGAS-like receptor 1 isoform X2 [Temnothorax americanus]|uniref:cGAS-like receptor 1 isoform X2 n=1 Tax=Temnothorax americanus TaxID=1964332 RepID=UPI00406834F1
MVILLQYWYRRFKIGDFDLEDKERPGHSFVEKSVFCQKDRRKLWTTMGSTLNETHVISDFENPAIYTHAMAQVADIDKYLVSDTIFEKINSKFIKMDSNDIKDQNQFLKMFFGKLINAMRKQSPLFDKTFQRIIWVGSYYKGTRFGEPKEYDLNFVINLPFEEKDIQFRADRPGFIKIRVPVWKAISSQNTLNLVPEAYKELNSFIDEESYLNQEKFRTWIERILSKVAHATGDKNDRIIFHDYTPIRKRKSGPAFTLNFNYGRNNEKTIDIDVVPVLTFSIHSLPPKSSKMNILQSRPNRCWSAVPKPLNNSRSDFGDLRHRYWRLCFYEFEKDMLCNHNYGRMKPVIRQLKKLRDTQEWASIASYYLETLCYHESEMFHISQRKSYTFLFFKMLEKLHDAFNNHCIKYYWDDDLNLLANIGREEMRNMEGRLDKILKNIRRTIKDDQYAIAKWVLNGDELEILKNLEHVTIPEREAQPQLDVVATTLGTSSITTSISNMESESLYSSFNKSWTTFGCKSLFLKKSWNIFHVSMQRISLLKIFNGEKLLNKIKDYE